MTRTLWLPSLLLPLLVPALLLLVACEPVRVTPFDLAPDAGGARTLIIGEGFEAYERMTVAMRFDEAGERGSGSAEVVDGTFSMVVSSPSAPVWTRVLIDVDFNGRCGPGEAFRWIYETPGPGFSATVMKHEMLRESTCPP